MSPADTRLAGVSILLVEDDEDNREILSFVLASAGATITVASTAVEAFETFKLAPSGVILTDIAMPNEDGVWLLQAVRASPELPRTPVVAISAHAMPKALEEFKAAGFDAIIAKPTDPERLVAVIRQVIGAEE